VLCLCARIDLARGLCPRACARYIVHLNPGSVLVERQLYPILSTCAAACSMPSAHKWPFPRREGGGGRGVDRISVTVEGKVEYVWGERIE